MIGGLDQAVKLVWPESSGTRVLFHLGDCPPHGKGVYHDFEDDGHPTGHPKDRPLNDLFQEMRSKKIAYYFGRITEHCDRMIPIFEKHYGDKIDQLESSKVSAITGHVTSSVMKSVSATCSAAMSDIKLEGSVIRTYVLDDKEPDWKRIPKVTAAIMTFKLPDTIRAITSFESMEEVVGKCRIQIARNPFAKGSVRLAYYGNIKANHIS